MSEKVNETVEEVKVETEGTGATTPEQAIVVSKPKKWLKWAIGGVVALIGIGVAAVFGAKHKDEDGSEDNSQDEKTETEE